MNRKFAWAGIVSICGCILATNTTLSYPFTMFGIILAIFGLFFLTALAFWGD